MAGAAGLGVFIAWLGILRFGRQVMVNGSLELVVFANCIYI